MRFLPIEDFDLGGPGEAASRIQIELMRHESGVRPAAQ